MGDSCSVPYRYSESERRAHDEYWRKENARLKIVHEAHDKRVNAMRKKVDKLGIGYRLEYGIFHFHVEELEKII